MSSTRTMAGVTLSAISEMSVLPVELAVVNPLFATVCRSMTRSVTTLFSGPASTKVADATMAPIAAATAAMVKLVRKVMVRGSVSVGDADGVVRMYFSSEGWRQSRSSGGSGKGAMGLCSNSTSSNSSSGTALDQVSSSSPSASPGSSRVTLSDCTPEAASRVRGFAHCGRVALALYDAHCATAC
jgi:hypothetical protein